MGMRGGLVRAVALAGGLAMTAGLAGCSSGSGGSGSSAGSGNGSSTAISIATVPDDLQATTVPAFYTPPKPLPAAPAGTLIRAQKVTGVPGVPNGATVYRILFHSRTIYGADIAESGYAVVPAGPAPTGGRPVLAWAHGTTGFTGICAPSIFTTADGVGPYLVPGLAQFLQAGYLVAATDYQGLGVPGLHPYLLGAASGRDVLDAAVAATRLPHVDAGRQLMIYGHSEGGQAALFAGQLAAQDAPGLHLAGVVAAAPASYPSLILAAATTDGPLGQGALGFTLPAAYTWAKTYKDLPESDLLTPEAQQVAPTVVTTGCGSQADQIIQQDKLTPSTVFVPQLNANPVVATHAKENDAGRVKTPAPILVLQGTADTTVPPLLNDAFVAQLACPIGDTVDYRHVTGATHGTVVQVGLPTILAWMGARISGGAPAVSTCGLPGNAATLTPTP